MPRPRRCAGLERLVGRGRCDAPRRRGAAGGFSLTVDLLDGQRWDNDWAADAYVPNSFGGDDSVVDLTALAEPVPSAAKKAPAKKEAMKKEGTKAAPVRATKKSAAPAANPCPGRRRPHRGHQQTTRICPHAGPAGRRSAVPVAG